MAVRPRIVVLSLLLTMLAAMLPAGAARNTLQPVSTGDGALFDLEAGEAVTFTLVVSGPDGIVWSQEFSVGQAPVFPLFTSEGPRPDGVYVFEVREGIARPHARAMTDRNAVPTAESGARSGRYWSGAFRIAGGQIVPPREEAAGMRAVPRPGLTNVPGEVVLTTADGVIRNSLCVGFDCPNSPVFSDSTILLMENNTRIKFGDTSNSPFPNNDWEIEANSSLSGGQSYLGFNDCGTADDDGGCADDLVFAVEAGARQNALYVESDGDVGIGTNNPVLDLHIVTGNTPALRLDQDNSSGFTPQVWDVAGNETNFFVRDVTAGSRLPFRIRPGAPTSSIDVAASGNVGIGTSAPTQALHVQRSEAGSLNFLVANTNSSPQVVSMVLDNTAPNLGSWEFRVGANGNLFINDTDSTGQVVLFNAATGSVTVQKDLTVNGIFSNPSSKALKKDIELVDQQDILARLVELPINEWTYSADQSGRRHVGPFTEDFQEAFGLGTTGRNIIPLDVQGVTIAALQGLHQTIETLRVRVETLEARLAEAERE